MRVVHVTPYFAPAFGYGGPPRSILGLCQSLQRAGVDVEVVTTSANGNRPLPIVPDTPTEYEGVIVTYAGMAFPQRFFGARLRAPLTAALQRADLCHVHGIWNVPEWVATRLARSAEVPYVVSPRGMLLAAARRRGRWRKAIAYNAIERPMLRRAAMLHATSSDEAAALGEAAPFVPVVVIPNGVTIDGSTAVRPPIRHRLSIPDGAFVVAFVGRIHPIKRLDLVAGAFVALRNRGIDAYLVLAGPDEGGLVPSIMRSVGSHGTAVRTLGEVDDADRWAVMHAADAVVQCSDSESFGLAVVEALAAGTPVVVTRTLPWRDIETARCGCWVEQSVPAITAALQVFATNPDERSAMGMRGAAYAREHYDWTAIGRRMADAYRTAVGRRRRAVV